MKDRYTFVTSLALIIAIAGFGGVAIWKSHEVDEQKKRIAELETELVQHRIAWDLINEGYRDHKVIPDKVLYPGGYVKDWEFPDGLLAIQTVDGWFFEVAPDKSVMACPPGDGPVECEFREEVNDEKDDNN